MKPTYEELLEENKFLRKKIQELEERLNLNSNNSSKPPSTDQKKNKQAPQGGAVKGHPGYSRKIYPPEQVSQTVRSSINHCSECGCSSLKKTGVQISQQVEIPPIKPFVTQIELEKARCTQCAKHLIAPFPEGYDRSSFGPRLISFIGMCSTVYRMSKRVVQTLLKTFFDIEIALGSIPAMERKLSRGLHPAYETIGTRAMNSQVANVDESPFREKAKTNYLWTLVTKTDSFFRILPTRGLDSLSKIRPRESKGITITDRYAVYSYEKHQYCLAHLYRDFKRFSQRDGPDGNLAKRVLFEFGEIFTACHIQDSETMKARVRYRRRRIKDIFCEIVADGSDKMAGLAQRLLDRFPRLFFFLKNPDVECTNNAAERALRHMVIWRKTSYGTQSDAGSRFLERAISIWMTLKKQGRDVRSFFQQAYQATFDPRIASPII